MFLHTPTTTGSATYVKIEMIHLCIDLIKNVIFKNKIIGLQKLDVKNTF